MAGPNQHFPSSCPGPTLPTFEGIRLHPPNWGNMTPIIKSVLSVVGAFFVVAVLVGLATALASRLMLGSTGPGTEPTTAYLVVNLACGVLFAIVGGYVAATVSDHSPLGHAVALSVSMMLLG